MHKVPVGVLGASGYAGRELCGLISQHPHLELAFATANEQRGERLSLPGGGSIVFAAPDTVSMAGVALVFSSLPHGASKDAVLRVRAAGPKVVDLSSDF